jgi:methionine aminopeptidase
VLFKNIKLLQKLQMVYIFLIFFLEVLAKVIKKISVGSKTFDICLYGDSLLIEELSKVYNKKQVFKGIAFPTCISVN